MVKKYSKAVVSWLLIFVLFLSPFATNAFALEQNTTGLDAGDYVVTANLYVKAQDNSVLGINAYLTNTALPPRTPVSENATLSVAADGEMTLKLNELNNVFTLQEIGGSNDAEIVKKTFTDDIQWPEDYTGEKKISSRISTLEIKLKQGVDKYVFSNCKEYPTLLADTNLEGYWNVPLTLEVDIGSAYIPFDENAEGKQTYSISDNGVTGVTVAVETSDEQMKSQMNTASLSATYTVNNDTITRLLKEKYDSEPSYTAYTLSMNHDFVGNTRATITLPTALTTAMHVYKLNNNDTLSEVGYYQWNSKTLNASVNTKNIIYNAEDKTISFVAPKLGTYIVLDIKDNYEYQIIEYPDAGNGVSYKMTDSTRWTTNKSSYALAKYIEDKNVKAISPKIEAVEGVGTAYSVGFTKKDEPYYMSTSYSSKANNKIQVPCYKLELTVPGNSDSKAYFITEDGQEFSPATLGAEQLPVTVSDDGKSIVITVCEITSSATKKTALNRIKLMEQRMQTDCVASSGGLSDMTGYVLVTDKDIAGMPIMKLSSSKQEIDGKHINSNALEYTGSNITVTSKIQNTNSDVSFTGLENVKDAGTYTAKIALPEGKYWADGTQGEKTINVLVRKRKLTATYKNEVIRVGETPTLNVTVDGWSSKDAELKNNSDYQPTLAAPSELKIGYYTLTPELPKLQSDNYYWVVNSGTLTVLPAEAQDSDQLVEIPTAITGLTYNGKEQTGVADPDENAGYTITDNKKTAAGTYYAVATLKDGYWWMDGTKEPKTIEWKIAEKQQSTVTDKETTVTANLYVPGELNKQLPGVTAYLTNGNNPNGEGGYEKKAPTEPVYDNAKLTTHSDGTRTLVLEVPNPVFTLQKLDGAPDGVSVSDIETTKCASAPKGTRISKVTIELPSKGDTFTFEDCEEYPTLLSTMWTVPLTLKLGKSGLDSKSDVDTGSVSGGTVAVKTDITVKVKDDTSTVSKINTDDLSSKNSITLDVTDGNKGVTGVNLPVSALEKIVDAKVPGTTLTLSDTSAKFDLAALTEVTKAASGKTALLRILTGTDAEKKLSATEKSAMSDVKNASAVSVALSSDDKAITSLGSGKLTVSVPYKWDAKGAVRAYQVDANGKLVSVPVTCKNNIAELTLTGTGNFILGTVDTKSFDDVADDAFYKTAVDWAVENGVTSGISDTLFAPAKTCTRAQVVTFLWRAAGSPEPTKTENPFTDVKSDAYYYKAVLWALEKGITSGTSATTFASENVVSRAQVVTFQWRMADSAKAAGTNNFTDVPADSYYKDAVQWAAEKGITSGTSATTFAPNAGCTRGQIVTFLYRQLGK